jgi:hypothetical protein
MYVSKRTVGLILAIVSSAFGYYQGDAVLQSISRKLSPDARMSHPSVKEVWDLPAEDHVARDDAGEKISY